MYRIVYDSELQQEYEVKPMALNAVCLFYIFSNITILHLFNLFVAVWTTKYVFTFKTVYTVIQ